MAFCTSCGSSIPDGSKFCTNCGVPVAQPVEPAQPIDVQPTDTTQQAQWYAGGQPDQQPAQQPYTPPSYGAQGDQPAPQSYEPFQAQPQGQQPFQQPQPISYAPAGQNVPATNDSGSIGWAILGFLIPIVGLILFFLWRNDKPQSAKMAGVGALVGFVINVFLVMFGAV